MGDKGLPIPVLGGVFPPQVSSGGPRFGTDDQPEWGRVERLVVVMGRDPGEDFSLFLRSEAPPVTPGGGDEEVVAEDTTGVHGEVHKPPDLVRIQGDWPTHRLRLNRATDENLSRPQQLRGAVPNLNLLPFLCLLDEVDKARRVVDLGKMTSMSSFMLSSCST